MPPTIRNLIADGHPVFRKGLVRVVRAAAGLVLALTALNAATESLPKGSPINTLGTIEEFPPVAARYVRMTILKVTTVSPILDEVEIYTAEPTPRNVALAANGGRASASSAPHPDRRVEFINDGLLSFWIGQKEMPNWIQIELAKTERINRIVWRRDGAEKRRSLGVWDGTPIDYRFEVAVEPGQWHLVASSSDHPPAPQDDEYLFGADFAGGRSSRPTSNPWLSPWWNWKERTRCGCPRSIGRTIGVKITKSSKVPLAASWRPPMAISGSGRTKGSSALTATSSRRSAPTIPPR
ncbi:MAG: hypothetical protein AAB676_12980 [Verrucomicrobiota bacterium]